MHIRIGSTLEDTAAQPLFQSKDDLPASSPAAPSQFTNASTGCVVVEVISIEFLGTENHITWERGRVWVIHDGCI